MPVAAPVQGLQDASRDGVMASPPPPRRRWLLEGAGAAFQHVLTASTVTYDHSLSTAPYAYVLRQAVGGVGGGPRGRDG